MCCFILTPHIALYIYAWHLFLLHLYTLRGENILLFTTDLALNKNLVDDIGHSQQTQNICITFVKCWANVEDVGTTLYKCYTNVLCVLG